MVLDKKDGLGHMYGSPLGAKPEILFGPTNPLLDKLRHANNIQSFRRVNSRNNDLRHVVLATLETLYPRGLPLAVESFPILFVRNYVAEFAISVQLRV